jgi:hypothetical protein
MDLVACNIEYCLSIDEEKEKVYVIFWYNSVGEYLSVVLVCLSVQLVQELLVDLLVTCL